MAGLASCRERSAGHSVVSAAKFTFEVDHLVQAHQALIIAKVAEASEMAAGNNVEPIHEIAEHLEVAVHFLEERSAMVTGKNRECLVSALGQFGKVVDDLHFASEEKMPAASVRRSRKS